MKYLNIYPSKSPLMSVSVVNFGCLFSSNNFLKSFLAADSVTNFSFLNILFTFNFFKGYLSIAPCVFSYSSRNSLSFFFKIFFTILSRSSSSFTSI